MLINKKSIISFGLIACMLMPKIDFISVPGFQQGLRYDDLFLLTGLIYMLLQRKIFLHVIPGRNIYFVFYGIILTYGILSLYFYGIMSIILAARWIEYSIFFMLLFYSSLNLLILEINWKISLPAEPAEKIKIFFFIKNWFKK